jgi:hypothetical protein
VKSGDQCSAAHSAGYVNDSKEGHGTFSWPDGRSYQGQWSEGKQSLDSDYVERYVERYVLVAYSLRCDLNVYGCVFQQKPIDNNPPFTSYT